MSKKKAGTIQTVMVKKTLYPGRRDAERLARHFGRVIDYDPGKAYHHFRIREAHRFIRIRTFTPRGVRGVKIKYGPLKRS